MLLLSAGLNVALLGLLFLALRSANLGPNDSALPPAPVGFADALFKTNVVVRRQYFSWQEIESTDYRTYINNLRAIGCPEPTIRDIIVAEVNTLFERKRATDIVLPEQHWWRSEPNPESVKAANEQFEAMETERRALLAELLGPSWEEVNTSELAEFNLRLDGPVLGVLSLKVKQAMREVEERAASKRQTYLEAQQRAGQPADPGVMARLAEESRQEMAALLTPQQLEEYLLRYSTTAQTLRAALHGLDTTPDEFRKIFRAREALDQQIAAFSSGNDGASVKRREELEKQQELAAKQALGPERYQMLQYARNPIFREARATAEQIGAPPETVLPLFQINQAVELERQRIRNDSNMTLEQRATALAAMLTQQQESLRRVLGSKGYELYRGRTRAE